MKRFEGKNILITGSSEGVGQVIAAMLAREGARLLLVNRRVPGRTMDLIRAEGGECDYVLCDITDETAVRALADKVLSFFGGRLDALINNAGFNGKAHLIADMPLADWQYTLSVNLTGTMLVCREMIPFLKGAAKAHGGAAVVNMSSNVGRRGLPYRSDYVCSKWALLGFTQTLALELAGEGVRVNAVCPGPIEGERIEQLVQMHAEAEGISYESMHASWEACPMHRFAKPEEVAGVIAFLLSSESSAMTGQALNITCGLIMT